MSDGRHTAGTCVSGCTVRDRHLGDCPCSGEHDREHEGHCRGCQPRAAEFGRLCAWSGYWLFKQEEIRENIEGELRRALADTPFQEVSRVSHHSGYITVFKVVR